MSASHSASETGLLNAIIYMSLILAAMSLCVIFFLFLKRRAQEKKWSHKARRREFLDRTLRGVLAAPMEPSAASVPGLLKGDEDIVLDMAVDMLRVIRGKDVARIIALLDIWNIREYLRATLMRGGRGRRIRIVTLLAHCQDSESLDLLLEQTATEDPYVQLAALRGVADRKAVDHLSRIVGHLPYSRQRNTLMLADILQRFGEPAVPVLNKLALEPGMPQVRLAAIHSLGAIGSIDAVDALLKLASDTDAELRAQTLAALGRIGDMRAQRHILRGLEDPVDEVRAQSAWAAGLMNLREAMPVLLARLGDSHWGTRYRAAEALFQMGPPGVAMLHAATRTQGSGGEMAVQYLAEKAAA